MVTQFGVTTPTSGGQYVKIKRVSLIEISDYKGTNNW